MKTESEKVDLKKPEGMDFDKAKKFEMLTIKDFCEKYADNITPQAVSYAINKEIVDFCWLGKERMVVMTKKTKEYFPNSHPHRDTLGAEPERK